MRKANPLHRFFALPNQSPIKAIGMTILVAFIASVLVSMATALLKPKQLANIEALRQQQMQEMLATLPGLEEVLRGSGADSLQTRLIDLNTGEFTEEIDAQNYDYMAATTDSAQNDVVTAENDIAGIGSRPRIAPVYLLQKQGKLELLVLPVYGTGYQSVIHAWLTLAGDLNTVVALTIVEQAETPGFGSRITDPGWQSLWKQKEIKDSNGDIAITVVRGEASNNNQVDGISGATRTSDGVTNMLRFWLGDEGFGPFLNNLEDGNLQAVAPFVRNSRGRTA